MAACTCIIFIIVCDHVLVAKMYWQMAWNAICWSLSVYLIAVHVSIVSQRH